MRSNDIDIYRCIIKLFSFEFLDSRGTQVKRNIIYAGNIGMKCSNRVLIFKNVAPKDIVIERILPMLN